MAKEDFEIVLGGDSKIDTKSIKKFTKNAKAYTSAIVGALEPGIDLAVITGTQRISLLQSGAEKLIQMFNLESDFNQDYYYNEIIHNPNMPENKKRPYIEYTYTCQLFARNKNGRFKVGKLGIGNANSFDSRIDNQLTDSTNVSTIQHNLIQKAQKRAMVQAVKSVAGLADIFNKELTPEDRDRYAIGSPTQKEKLVLYTKYYKAAGITTEKRKVSKEIKLLKEEKPKGLNAKVKKLEIKEQEFKDGLTKLVQGLFPELQSPMDGDMKRSEFIKIKQAIEKLGEKNVK